VVGDARDEVGEVAAGEVPLERRGERVREGVEWSTTACRLAKSLGVST
jgi:hypothetical protein